MRRTANTYFQFKQFRIEQDRCAMKVSTDAVVLGSLAVAKSIPDTILDIGTGTGVLALMMAQKYPSANIDAVEIDLDAFEQATKNVAANKLGTNITVKHQGFQDFATTETQQYDLIITNPPYYSGQLQSSKQNINLARHEQGLNFTDLWAGIDSLLTEAGVLWLILPPNEMETFIGIGAEKGFYPVSQTFLHDRETSKVHRVIVSLSRKKPAKIVENTLLIKDPSNAYTSEYVDLLKDFMLHF
ncbi:tRNA1(Val) (adenine(37)-N6)-methyltransferase [Cyclobacterium qasimii]|uniref:tRNA1(Val) (adenine(37)-N6)-methyltransferase n=2 Tax=Cyclobacterium qasimii TaxID=1350429 RepID=S7V9Q6_9BACT|nr:methyltransferase [Cyclobacterium qasimii]EPR66292.1 tRNA (adenine37-N(6))-methyltransferase TrmN6 [Cyclobacterium qasimii M12-11B]GEO21032.1 tRNA1(Val) (adenine(37)-N6)-methyltransferase [Cyclobacterium qasimii]